MFSFINLPNGFFKKIIKQVLTYPIVCSIREDIRGQFHIFCHVQFGYLTQSSWQHYLDRMSRYSTSQGQPSSHTSLAIEGPKNGGGQSTRT